MGQMAATAGGVAIGSVVGTGLSNMIFGGGSKEAAPQEQQAPHHHNSSNSTMVKTHLHHINSNNLNNNRVAGNLNSFSSVPKVKVTFLCVKVSTMPLSSANALTECNLLLWCL